MDRNVEISTMTLVGRMGGTHRKVGSGEHFTGALAMLNTFNHIAWP